MNINGLYRLVIHVDIPNLQCQVISRKDISTIMTKVDIRDRRDDLGKERTVGRILSFLKD
jgi:hypothetical protein